MPRALRLVVLACSLNVAWAQPVPAPDPAMRLTPAERSGQDIRNVCAAQPALQRDVIDPRTAPRSPVDCAQVLGASPTPGTQAVAREIAPFRVESRTTRSAWQIVGDYGSRAAALEAAHGACAASAPPGTPRTRAARVSQSGRSETTAIDCRRR